jgi:hypothetical protein
MDLNLAVLCGRLACSPEWRTDEFGSGWWRILVVVRTEVPFRRIDVIPVNVSDVLTDLLEAGSVVWVVGSVRRRFWEDHDGRRSSIEIDARQVRTVRPGDRAMLVG